MRAGSFKSNSGSFKVTPYLSNDVLTHIKIHDRTDEVTINTSDLQELIKTLTELSGVYLNH